MAREVQVKETTHQETKPRILHSTSQGPSRMNYFNLRNPEVLKFRPVLTQRLHDSKYR